MMAQEKTRLSFTFVNPNGQKAFVRGFRRVLIDRMIAAQKQRATA